MIFLYRYVVADMCRIIIVETTHETIAAELHMVLQPFNFFLKFVCFLNQVNHIIDVGSAAYAQLEKMKGKEVIEEDQTDSKGKKVDTRKLYVVVAVMVVIVVVVVVIVVVSTSACT